MSVDGHHAAAARRSRCIWGIDAVHGHNNIVGATLFPHNIGLGATRDPDLVRADRPQVTAVEMRGHRHRVDVRADRRRCRATTAGAAPTRATPRIPAVVRTLAAAMVEGLQGKAGTPGVSRRGPVVATAKHFLGDGGTTGGKDQGDTQVERGGAARHPRRRLHRRARRRRADGDGLLQQLARPEDARQPGLLTDVLKGRLGFDGFVVGDWNGHGAGAGLHQRRAARRRFNAGLDMFMAPDSWKGLYANTLAQVRRGEIPMARLDDAVRRILRVKMRAGPVRAASLRSGRLAASSTQLGAPAHRAVARQAVRESLVLLKNDGGLLPLRPDRQRAGGGRRRRRHRQAVRRLDAHLAGHRHQARRLPQCATRSGPASAGRTPPRAARPSSPWTAATPRSPTSPSWCSARNPTPNSRATCPT